ncbi:hypothetical protein CsSME_00039152 [Camellia sinensis var. sinensis]
MAWLGKIKTSSFLHRIGILTGNVNLDCVFCHNEIETVEHILLYYPFVWLLWSNIVRWWGLQWVLPGSVNGLLNWWDGCRLKKLEKKIWKVLSLAVLWSTWKHRNDCIFNGSQPNLEDLCEIVKVRVAMWLKASPTQVEFSINDLVLNLPQVNVCGVLSGCCSRGLIVVQRYFQNYQYMVTHQQTSPNISRGLPTHVPKWLPPLHDVSTKPLPKEWSCHAGLDPAYPRPELVSPRTRHPHQPLSRSNLTHGTDPAHTSEAYSHETLYLRETTGTFQLVKQIIYTGHRVFILNRSPIQLSVVDTQSQGTIFLFSKEAISTLSKISI